MKKRNLIAVLNIGLSVFIMAALPSTAFAKMNSGVNGGYFSNFDTLTWTANDGTVTTYGRGSKFCDVWPDVTDPEYFLKEYNLETEGSYSPEIVSELKTFVRSFDWIHSDELTRATMVHDRIGNGCHGNTYEHSSEDYSVLMTGKGTCGNFSGEFRNLARFVGLECEVYTPSYLHQACLIKINGQWFATDPTGAEREGLFLSNAVTYPVDYETEYNRYANERDAETFANYNANPDDMLAKAAMMRLKILAGEITVEQYNAMWENGELY